jgi:hypothetical protein
MVGIRFAITSIQPLLVYKRLGLCLCVRTYLHAGSREGDYSFCCENWCVLASIYGDFWVLCQISPPLSWSHVVREHTVFPPTRISLLSTPSPPAYHDSSMILLFPTVLFEQSGVKWRRRGDPFLWWMMNKSKTQKKVLPSVFGRPGFPETTIVYHPYYTAYTSI